MTHFHFHYFPLNSIKVRGRFAISITLLKIVMRNFLLHKKKEKHGGTLATAAVTAGEEGSEVRSTTTSTRGDEYEESREDLCYVHEDEKHFNSTFSSFSASEGEEEGRSKEENNNDDDEDDDELGDDDEVARAYAAHMLTMKRLQHRQDDNNECHDKNSDIKLQNDETNDDEMKKGNVNTRKLSPGEQEELVRAPKRCLVPSHCQSDDWRAEPRRKRNAQHERKVKSPSNLRRRHHRWGRPRRPTMHQHPSGLSYDLSVGRAALFSELKNYLDEDLMIHTADVPSALHRCGWSMDCPDRQISCSVLRGYQNQERMSIFDLLDCLIHSRQPSSSSFSSSSSSSCSSPSYSACVLSSIDSLVVV